LCPFRKARTLSPNLTQISFAIYRGWHYYVPEIPPIEGKMENPKKLPIYESLHAINQATAQITEHIERLKMDGLIKSEQADIHKLTAEETRALVCYSTVLSLIEQEQSEAARIQGERIAKENDILK